MRPLGATEKEGAVCVNVGRSELGSVGNDDRIHPGEPAVGGTAEFHGVVRAGAIPKLVLEPVTHAGRGVIYSEPLLITAGRGSNVRESLATVDRAPHRDEKCLQKT